MKCYFYTDPLAAAWMVRHHRMTLTWESDEAMRDLLMPVRNAQFAANKYYIRPDSLRLLEPQVGDILRLYFFTPEEDDKAGAVMTGFYAGGREAITWFRDPEDGGIDRQLHKIDDHQWRIIQRAGKAFHHPESEDV
jgi:hypothetical protein